MGQNIIKATTMPRMMQIGVLNADSGLFLKLGTLKCPMSSDAIPVKTWTIREWHTVLLNLCLIMRWSAILPAMIECSNLWRFE